jgi:hypothetical protein
MGIAKTLSSLPIPFTGEEDDEESHSHRISGSPAGNKDAD